MKRSSSLLRLACASAALLTLHCSGGVSAGNGAQGGADGSAAYDASQGPDAQNPSDANTSGDGCASPTTGTGHRAQAMACSPTPPDSGINNFDGGPVVDGCLTDSDCGDSGVCSCRGNTFGWSHVSAANSCVPSNCRVDSDCGPGGVCSPTVSPGCGPFYGVFGYYCRTCADRCQSDSDCQGDVEAGMPATGYCAYDPAVGYWACGFQFCAG